MVTLEPYLKPIMQTATGTLSVGSAQVINNQWVVSCTYFLLTSVTMAKLTHRNQYAVFDDPMASDPTHSLLSKDHFAMVSVMGANSIVTLTV